MNHFSNRVIVRVVAAQNENLQQGHWSQIQFVTESAITTALAQEATLKHWSKISGRVMISPTESFLQQGHCEGFGFSK